MIYTFYYILIKTYSVKRLGKPTDFLCWIVTQNPDGAIGLIHPTLVQPIIENYRMVTSNCRSTPYNYTVDQTSRVTDTYIYRSPSTNIDR